MSTKIILSSPQKTLIEMMFEKHEYSEQDIRDFFERGRMDRRFAQEKRDIRAARAARETVHQFQLASD